MVRIFEQLMLKFRQTDRIWQGIAAYVLPIFLVKWVVPNKWLNKMHAVLWISQWNRTKEYYITLLINKAIPREEVESNN